MVLGVMVLGSWYWGHGTGRHGRAHGTGLMVLGASVGASVGVVVGFVVVGGTEGVVVGLSARSRRCWFRLVVRKLLNSLMLNLRYSNIDLGALQICISRRRLCGVHRL